MRIVFVRHGEPDYEKDCLTALGRLQAQAAAIRLQEEGIGEIWSSPLGRARETAEAASEVLGLPVRTLDFMREVSWGSRDDTPLFAGGHPWAITGEMARLGIDMNRPDWRESPFFRLNLVLDCIDGIDAGIDGWLAGFGYLREAVYYRQTAEEAKPRTVALFSHGGSSCAALGRILNLTFPYACALFHQDFTGITVLRLEGKAGAYALPRLELSNDAKHIRELRLPPESEA